MEKRMNSANFDPSHSQITGGSIGGMSNINGFTNTMNFFGIRLETLQIPEEALAIYNELVNFKFFVKKLL
jgi:hypothetical protein